MANEVVSSLPFVGCDWQFFSVTCEKRWACYLGSESEILFCVFARPTELQSENDENQINTNNRTKRPYTLYTHLVVCTPQMCDRITQSKREMKQMKHRAHKIKVGGVCVRIRFRLRFVHKSSEEYIYNYV